MFPTTYAPQPFRGLSVGRTNNRSGLIASAGDTSQVFNEPAVGCGGPTFGGWQNPRADLSVSQPPPPSAYAATDPAHQQPFRSAHTVTPAPLYFSPSGNSHLQAPHHHHEQGSSVSKENAEQIVPHPMPCNGFALQDVATQLSSLSVSAPIIQGPVTTQGFQQQQPRAQTSPVSSGWSFKEDTEGIARTVQNATHQFPHSDAATLYEGHGVDKNKRKGESRMNGLRPAQLMANATEVIQPLTQTGHAFAQSSSQSMQCRLADVTADSLISAADKRLHERPGVNADYLQTSPAVRSHIDPFTDRPIGQRRTHIQAMHAQPAQLQVCENNRRGCKWFGDPQDPQSLQDHMGECIFRLVPCPHSGCEEQPLLACDFLRHNEECGFRPLPCRVCRSNVPQASMNDHLIKECMECPVICPNGCGSEVKRKDLEGHRTQDCSHVQHPCPFNVYSCVFKGTRDQVDRHWRTESQQHNAMKAVHDHQSSLVAQVSALQQTVELMQERHARDQNEIKRLEESCEQEDCSRTLREQVQGCSKSLGELREFVNRVDERLQGVESSGRDGVIIMKINNFAQHHEEARTGHRVSLYSQTFSTSQYGYRVRLIVYLNGEGSGLGTHVSVYFAIMKGGYDSLLEWPFRAKVTFAVLDQRSPPHHCIESFIPDPCSSCFHRPVHDTNDAYGYRKMVSHRELHHWQRSYLLDDCLCIKVSID